MFDAGRFGGEDALHAPTGVYHLVDEFHFDAVDGVEALDESLFEGVPIGALLGAQADVGSAKAAALYQVVYRHRSFHSWPEGTLSVWLAEDLSMSST